MLDVKGTTKGMLVPRVALTSTASQSPINPAPDASLAVSLLVYNTATAGDVTPGYYYWNGSGWERLLSGNTPPLLTEVDPTFTGAANTTGAISRTGAITVGNRLTLNAAGFDEHLLIQRASAPDARISTSTASWIQMWPGAAGDYTTKGLRINNSGSIQLMGYGNGILRATASNGTLTSGGAINLTSEVTGLLPVANGGSGIGTLTGYLRGNGTSPFSATATVPWTDISGAPTSFAPSGTAGGDLSGTYPNPQVVDDSHNHTELEAKAQYSWNASTAPRDFPQAIAASFVQAANGWPEYGSVVHVGTYPNDGGALQLYAPYNATYGGNSLRYRLGLYNNAGWTAWKTIWDDTNDGAGSGMDADLLDGQQGSYYAAAANVSGTTNYVSKFTGANTIGNSQIFDNGTNVGVGTTTNSYKLQVNGSIGLNRNNLHFQESGGSIATDGSYGIYWHNSGGSTPSTDYAIYRTPGAWTASVYQQLRMQFTTGIELGAGTGANAGYDRSYVNIVNGKGLMVSSGNLGIGTTAPVTSLELEGPSANWNETTPGTGVGSIHLDPGSAADHFGSAITWGASDASNGDNAQAGIYVRSDGGYGTKMYLSTTDSYASGSKSRLFINHNGDIGINNTAPTYKLHVTGTIRTNAINETSDARLKTEVTQLSDALAKVMAMRGVNYMWKYNEYPEMELDTTIQFGLIAQELEKVVPQLVKVDKEGWRSIEYSHIIPLLIEGMKEQQQVIARLEASLGSEKAINTIQNDSLSKQQQEIDELRSMITGMQDQLIGQGASTHLHGTSAVSGQ